MNETEFKKRTKEIALRTIRLIESLPQTTTVAAFLNQRRGELPCRLQIQVDSRHDQ